MDQVRDVEASEERLTENTKITLGSEISIRIMGGVIWGSLRRTSSS